MAEKKQRFVFGPVASRRLGRSLGIDLVPFKTCSYDCVYCQLGRTTCRTAQRAEYAPPAEVLGQLEAALAAGPPPDVITLAGSGEPTLHSGLREILAGIKRLTDLPLVVLTNGSLLFLPEVRDALQSADVVAPDLDAGSETAWRAVCRPADGLSFARVVDGLQTFAREYRGRLEYEVFLVDGLYDLEAEVGKIAALLSGLPGQVRLNTTARPTAEVAAGMVAVERLAQFALRFDPPAGLIPELKLGDSSSRPQGRAGADEVADLVSRHPATLPEIASALGLSAARAEELVAELLAAGRIASRRHQGRTFFEGAKPIGD